MKYSFTAFGHPNITAKHKTTIELTKDNDLTLNGDCIIGVNSDFKLNEIKKFQNKIKIMLKVNSIKEEINCEVNHDFDDDNEIVIRKSDFISNRTLGIKSDKACIDLKKELINKLKNPDQKIEILITDI